MMGATEGPVEGTINEGAPLGVAEGEGATLEVDSMMDATLEVGEVIGAERAILGVVEGGLMRVPHWGWTKAPHSR
jgi:hypothetical protein